MDCKTKIEPTSGTISKQQTWLKSTLASSNQKQAFRLVPRLRYLLRERIFSN